MHDLTPGNELDHYRIEASVARSGMATLYRATDLRTGQVVAIKMPHPEMESDPVFFERFRREESTLLRLRHPGVVQVFDASDRSSEYLVMEWVEGCRLRDILKGEGRLPIERALRLAVQICEALAYLHHNQVAHRDLKPENIMVDGEDHIKLIDFGLAAASGVRRLTFTHLSPAMGTPDYIAPEQVKGQRGDARSDLYSLGAILYEMLAGRPPFQGANAFAVMNERLLNDPRPIRELRPEVEPALQEILQRALEREPKQRYASADEMLWDLNHPDQVAIQERTQRPARRGHNPQARQTMLYAGLAMLPVAIFLLLLYFSRH